uniref:Thiamin biosynthesis protein S n=1 Tax=Antithamnion hubbsii TaxID=1005974 RepID=A0A4D6WMP3_9FLOR|nr:Thiamin biosynthesis protein S [Antithamnion hubbsii]
MNKEYYKIIVNGEPFNCYKSMSLQDILIYLDINIHTVIVEYNQVIINFSQFEYIFVRPNDYLEIITIVGGG